MLLTMKKAALFSVLVLCVLAFKPNDIGHAGITEQALADLGFTAVARDAVANANILTDIFEQLTHEAHFDDEYIEQGSKRLLDKKDEIYQVFLAIATELDKSSNSPSPSSSSDSSDFFDLPDFVKDTTTNLIDRVNSLFGLNAESEISEAWTMLGQALHGLQDFYSHSNWVEMGNRFPNTDLGRKILETPENKKPCPNDPSVLDLNGDGGNFITTSYFIFEPSKHCDLHATLPGKCRHGWDFAGCATGLNKDEPTRPNFDSAKALAIESTKNYVQLVLNTLNDLPFKEDEVRSLFLGGAEYDATTNPIISSQFIGQKNTEAVSTCADSVFTIDNTGNEYNVIVDAENYDSITLFNPSNAEVTSTSSTEDRKEFKLGDNPVTGTWKVTVCSNDNNNLFHVDVQIISTYFVKEFDFLRVLDPRSTFLFPLSPITEPIFGVSESYLSQIFGKIVDESIKFELVDVTGENVIAVLPSVLVSTFSDSSKYSTNNTGVFLPSRQPFRVRVSGRTSDTNENFVRYNNRIFTPQTVGVQFSDSIAAFTFGPDMVSENNGINLSFDVTNHGNVAAEFDLKASINSSSSADFKVSIEVTSSGSKKREMFLSPHERMEAKKDRDSHNVRPTLKRGLLDPRDVDSGEETVTIASLETITVTVTVVLQREGDIQHGDLLQLSLSASNGDTSNADLVVGQYLACPGDPVCSGQGACTGVDTCTCNEGFGGNSCDGDSPSPSGLLSFGSPSSNSPSSNNNNNNSSGGSVLSVGFSVVLALISFVFFM
eukprot:TRINITY_DN965_c0_g1_i1.p2 TRINITY_DN965_c0_g1~~TRINITY_DN965_c0_g1_i1.p2  ORF type:complete len:772 (+),score=381.97 TRINITY_DN965_c0_g1_i1:2522-4837(+)